MVRPPGFPPGGLDRRKEASMLSNSRIVAVVLIAVAALGLAYLRFSGPLT
jgi:hypothetical protein